MKLSIFDLIIAEGEEAELAMYTLVLLDMMKKFYEHEKEEMTKKELGLHELFSKMTLEQLMKREQEKEDEDGT